MASINSRAATGLGGVRTSLLFVESCSCARSRMSADDLARVAAAEKEALEHIAKQAFLDRRRRLRIDRIDEFVRGYCQERKDEASLREYERLPEGKRNRYAYVCSREFTPPLTAEILRDWHHENYPEEAVLELPVAAENEVEEEQAVQGFAGLAEEITRIFRNQGISEEDISDLSPEEWREAFPIIGTRVRARKWAKSAGLLGAEPAIMARAENLDGSPRRGVHSELDGKHAGSLLGLEAAVTAFAAPREAAPPEAKLRAALQARGLGEISGASLLPTDCKREETSISSLLTVDSESAKVDLAVLERERVYTWARQHPACRNRVPSSVEAALGLITHASASVSRADCRQQDFSCLRRIVASAGFEGVHLGGLTAGFTAYIGLQTIADGNFASVFQPDLLGDALAPLVRARAYHSAQLRAEFLRRKLALENAVRGARGSAPQPVPPSLFPPIADFSASAAGGIPSAPLASRAPRELRQRPAPPAESVLQPTARPGGGAPPSVETVRLFKTAWDNKFRRGRAPSSPQCMHCLIHHRPNFMCFLYMLPGHRNSMCAEAWAAAGLPDAVSEWNSRVGRKSENRAQADGKLAPPHQGKKHLAE